MLWGYWYTRLMVGAKAEFGPHIDVPDYHAISRNFALELKRAESGEKTDLPFIVNHLPEEPLLKPGQHFQVFVIGGTNGSTASGTVAPEGVGALAFEKSFSPLPNFKTKEDFLSFVESNIDDKAEALGINFAYNLIPTLGEFGELDGVMNQGDTKGHSFVGLQQEQVGKTIAQYFKSKGRDLTVTVANDTICLLTSGLEEVEERENLIALIVGTGYNIALFSSQYDAVNLQASDFRGFEQTATGKDVDAASSNIGEQLYNKEVAAGELYKHYNILIPSLNLSLKPLSSTKELSLLARNGGGMGSQIAQELFERSASLVAAHLAGIFELKGRPNKITCIIQGSLLLKEPTYLSALKKRLKALGVPENSFEFKTVGKSDVLGVVKLLTA